ncbi:putative arginine--tRNA ligase, mitochondrial isoform X2 [Tubulanus polymorphus]
MNDVSKKSCIDKPNMKISETVMKKNGIHIDSSVSPAAAATENHEDLEFIRGKKEIAIKYDSKYFTKKVLKEIISENSRAGLNSQLHRFYKKNGGQLVARVIPENVIVEFSSPNIAKPFHAGHLRSTIIGNFVANINEALNNNVTRINYLGDWGTQFGILSVGFKKYGCHNRLKSDAMKHLFEVYVAVNKDVESEEKDSGVSKTRQLALQHLTRMETDDGDLHDEWKLFRDSSIDSYSAVYKRLGIHFDEYHGESMYYKSAHDVLNEAELAGILSTNSKGIKFIDLSESFGGQSVSANLLKSDGSTLYITRDLAAILDRYRKYQFNRIHYVVEQGQNLHFKQMVAILQKLGHQWINNCDNLHIGFGRVQGMSTRQGNVVFLSDILDEAKLRMLKIMSSKQSTKAAESVEETADILGMSAVIVQDLKQRKNRDYDFDWDRMLDNRGDTGVSLQYNHARLYSIEKNCGIEMNLCSALESLTEAEAIRLTLHLAKFDEIVNECYSTLEAHSLVTYLFKLVHLSNAAIHGLSVKGSPKTVAEDRLFLFVCARIILSNGMKLLGLKPLKSM